MLARRMYIVMIVGVCVSNRGIWALCKQHMTTSPDGVATDDGMSLSDVFRHPNLRNVRKISVFFKIGCAAKWFGLFGDLDACPMVEWGWKG